MAYMIDEKDAKAVFDPEKNRRLTRYVRDVPVSERWFYFEVESKKFVVKSKFISSEEEKYFKFVVEIDDSWNNFNNTILFSGQKYKLSLEDFKGEILPALTDAIVCLQFRRMRPAAKADGWQVMVEYVSQPSVASE